MSVDVYVTTTVQEEKQGEARESGRRIASQNFINLLPSKMRVPVDYYIEERELQVAARKEEMAFDEYLYFT